MSNDMKIESSSERRFFLTRLLVAGAGFELTTFRL